MSTIASPASVDFLETLWSERSDLEFPREKFAAYPQIRVSALIDEVKTRPALPVTESMLDEINALSAELGKSFDVKDRAQASRILSKLRREARIARYHAARGEASSELDELLTPAF